jgi:hypothetical protein
VKGKKTPPTPEKELPPPPVPHETRDRGQDVHSERALKTALRLETPMKGIHNFAYPFLPIPAVLLD